MSSGHSSAVMCENHKNNFRIGFQHQNKSKMTGGNFLSCDKIIVKGKTEKNTQLIQQNIRDIGGYFVSNSTIYLRELLPNPYNLLDYNFTIEEDDNVFFEIITQQHGNIWNNPTEFIKSKIDFHKQNNKDFEWNVDSSKHVLVLIYNGADSVVIGKKFRNLCSLNAVRGTIVHISYDTVSHWDLLLQIDEWRSATLQLLEQPDDDTDGTIFESIFDLNEYLLTV
jgi:hypothetical protein